MYQAGLLLVLLLMSGCDFDTRFNTVAPERITETTAVEYEESMIMLPVQIETEAVRQLLQQSLDEQSDNDRLYFERMANAGNGTTVIFFLKHWARVSMLARNNTLEMRIPMDVYLRADWQLCKDVEFDEGVKRVCIDDHEDVNAEFNVIARISPTLNQDYLLEPNVEVDYALDRKTRINIGPTSINLLTKMQRILDQKLIRFEEKLSAYVEQHLNARSYAQYAWNIAQQPFSVTRDRHDWLRGDLSRLFATPLSTTDNVGRFGIGIAGRFSVTEGAPSEVGELKPLPGLQPLSRASGFVLNLSRTVNNHQLGAQLNTQLMGHSIVHQGAQLTLNKFRVYGAADGRLVVGIRVMLKAEGSWLGKAGWIYLSGQPVYSPQVRRMSLRTVNFDVGTEQVLLKVAPWMTSPEVLSQLQDLIGFTLAGEMFLAESSVQNYMHEMNSSGLWSGNLQSVAVGGLSVQPSGLLISVNATGSMQMDVPELPDIAGKLGCCRNEL